MQWNIRGFRANYIELQLLINSHQPVALCLQELLIADSYQFQNKQYSLVSKLPDLDSHNRPTGGTGILIRKDIPHSVIPLHRPLQAVACRISIPDPITVCSVYLPPSSIWNHRDLLNLVSKFPTPNLCLIINLLLIFTLHQDRFAHWTWPSVTLRCTWIIHGQFMRTCVVATTIHHNVIETDHWSCRWPQTLETEQGWFGNIWETLFYQSAAFCYIPIRWPFQSVHHKSTRHSH